MARLAVVHGYFRRWWLDGTWESIHRTPRQHLSLQLHCDSQLSAGSVDSQSVKTAEVGGMYDYDDAKKLVCRKRYILIDTEGLIQTINVHPANIMERDGIKLVLE